MVMDHIILSQAYSYYFTIVGKYLFISLLAQVSVKCIKVLLKKCYLQKISFRDGNIKWFLRLVHICVIWLNFKTANLFSNMFKCLQVSTSPHIFSLQNKIKQNVDFIGKCNPSPPNSILCKFGVHPL